MPSLQMVLRLSTAFILLLSLVVLQGCISGQGNESTGIRTTPLGNQGYLSLFLNLKDKNSPAVGMQIQQVEILAESGNWLPLTSAPIQVHTKTIRAGQVFLLRGRLMPGYYSRIRLVLGQAWQGAPEQTDNALSLSDQDVEIRLPNALYIGRGDSQSIFLTWDVGRSLNNSNRFTPHLSAAPKLKNMIVDVAYVACPEIQTIFMIRTDKNWVFDSLGIQGQPTFLASSSLYPATSLFALVPDQQKVVKISPAANRVIESYNLSMTGNPSHMVLAPDGTTAYILDQARGNILRMDLRSGHIEKRNRLGHAPSYIIYLPKQKLLAVSLSRSQNVVLVDPDTLSPVQTISTARRPEGLMLWNDALLYIAESGANSVLVYDLINSRESKRIAVDFTPRRIISAGGYIYVANYNSKSISRLSPGQLGVSRTLPLDGRPLEMAYDEKNRWIYVGNADRNALDILDPSTGKPAGRIELGSRPLGIRVVN